MHANVFLIQPSIFKSLSSLLGWEGMIIGRSDNKCQGKGCLHR